MAEYLGMSAVGWQAMLQNWWNIVSRRAAAARKPMTVSDL